MKKVLFLALVAFTFAACGGTTQEHHDNDGHDHDHDGHEHHDDSAPSGNTSEEKPVNWTWEAKDLGNGEYEFIFKAEIHKGWYVYSQNLGDGGPIPTNFTFESDNVTSEDKAVEKPNNESYKIEGKDPLFDNMQITKFKKGVVFTKKGKVTDTSKPVAGYLTFMTCDNTKCLPPRDIDFSFELAAK